MGGPAITPKIERLIGETYYELEYEMGEEPIAKVVLNKAKQKYDNDPKLKYSHFPKLRKVQDIIQNIRDEQSKSNKDKPELDKSWSLGSLDKYPITPDVLPTVGLMWRCCLALDMPFTIRHARWLDRLFIPLTWHLEGKTIEAHGEHFIAYYDWIKRYVIREKVDQFLERSCDTSDLDAVLFMDYREYWGAIILGKIEFNKSDEVPHELDIGETKLESVYPDESIGIIAVRMALPELDSYRPTTKFSMCEPNCEFGFAHWVTYFSHGPNWGKLSVEERIEIIDWLAHEENWLDINNYTTWQDGYPVLNLPDSPATALNKAIALKVGYIL